MEKESNFYIVAIIWLMLVMIMSAIFDWWSFDIMIGAVILGIFFLLAERKKNLWIVFIGIGLEAIIFLLGFSTKTRAIFSIIAFALLLIYVLSLYAKKKHILESRGKSNNNTK